MSIGADPFFVGSDVLDLGSRKAELRGRRNRMTPLDHDHFGMQQQMMVPHVPNVSLILMCMIDVRMHKSIALTLT